jgi:type III secretion system chaperone SycN
MLEYEVQTFGRRLGLEALTFSSSGLARLDIDNVGSLYLERSDQWQGRQELLIYLSASFPEHDIAALRRLMALGDYRHGWGMPLFAGVFSGKAILLTRLPEESVTASGLENILRLLADQLHSALMERSGSER